MPYTYSWLSYFDIYVLPVIFAFASVNSFSALTVRSFVLHRREMSDFLRVNPDLDRQYRRLMYLACTLVALMLPTMTFLLIFTATSEGPSSNGPYKSWGYVHEYLNVIGTVDAQTWSASGSTIFNIKWNEWALVFFFLPFFFFFALTKDVKKMLVDSFWFVRQMLGAKRPVDTNASRVASGLHFQSPPRVPTKSATSFMQSVGMKHTTVDVQKIKFPQGDVVVHSETLTFSSMPIELSELEKGVSERDDDGSAFGYCSK